MKHEGVMTRTMVFRRLILYAAICALAHLPRVRADEDQPYRLEFRPNRDRVLDLSPTIRRYNEKRGRSLRAWRPANEVQIPPMAMIVNLSQITLGMNRRQAEDALGKQWVEFTSDKDSTTYMNRAFPGFMVYIAYAVTERSQFLGRYYLDRSGPDSAVLDRPAVVATQFPTSWIPEPYQPPLPFAYNRPPFPRRSIVVRGNGYNLQPDSPTR